LVALPPSGISAWQYIVRLRLRSAPPEPLIGRQLAVEGALTVLVGLICVPFLPDSPEDAKFLTEAERRLAIDRIKSEMPHNEGPTDTTTFSRFKHGFARPAVLGVGVPFMSVPSIGRIDGR
jgi:hypothetical protein